MEEDVRWLQRLDSFRKACRRVLEITESDKEPDDLSELEQEGLVQRFEYTYELAWKVMQDFLKYKGYDFALGPNGTLQKAFEDGLITLSLIHISISGMISTKLDAACFWNR